MRISNNPPNLLVAPEYVDNENYLMFATRLNGVPIIIVLRNKYAYKYSIAISLR